MKPDVEEAIRLLSKAPRYFEEVADGVVAKFAGVPDAALRTLLDAYASREAEAGRLERLLAYRDKMAVTHAKFLMRDIEEALAGDTRALRTRLGLMQAGPVEIVASDALATYVTNHEASDGK